MTPAPRLAVYGAPPILAALDSVGAGRTDGDQSRTARLAVICERHDAIVADACPALTAAEWAVILDVRNGAHLLEEAGAMSGPATVAAEIEDLLDDPTWASRHPEIDRDGVLRLARTVADLTFAGRVAVVEVAQRWWARRTDLAPDIASSVSAVGGRVARGGAARLSRSVPAVAVHRAVFALHRAQLGTSDDLRRAVWEVVSELEGYLKRQEPDGGDTGA